MIHWSEALLRVSIFFACWIGIWATIAFPLFKKFDWRPFQTSAPEQKLILLLILYCLAPGLIWGANQIWHQSWQSLGVVWSLATAQSLGIGFAIAVVGLCLLLLFKRAAGLVSFTILSDADPPDDHAPATKQLVAIAGLLLLGIGIGGVEELVFRGWLQTQLELAFSPWLAATLGSALFAVAHLVWDGREGLRQQPGLFLLGWVFVIARWADGGSLALAWGLHAGWVWALAYVGEFIKPQPMAGKPVWLTGKAAQPLTDVLDWALMVITAGLVWRFFSLA